MTVRQLVQQLQLCHPDSEVHISFEDSLGYIWYDVARVNSSFEDSMAKAGEDTIVTSAKIDIVVGEQVGAG